jgi:hypothetical protein
MSVTRGLLIDGRSVRNTTLSVSSSDSLGMPFKIKRQMKHDFTKLLKPQKMVENRGKVPRCSEEELAKARKPKFPATLDAVIDEDDEDEH